MRITIFVTLTLLITMVGCGIFNSDDWVYSQLSAREVISITDSVRYTNPVTFEIESAFNTPCYEYGNMDVGRSGTNIYVRFVQKKKSNSGICSQVEVPYIINERIAMLTPGRYNFHFRQTDSTSIDTVVIVY